MRAFDGDLRRDGFALLPDFVEPTELNALRAEVEDVLAQPLPPGCERPHNTLAPLRWSHRPVDRVLSSARRRDALAEAIEAGDLRWISAYVSVMEARCGPLWWHQDWWCWDHEATYRSAPSQVAVLCYLSDTTASKGALRLLPGTHRRSIRLHAALPEAHADQAPVDPAHPAMADHRDQLTLELRAGDAVAIDYRLLHGAHPNDGEERRDCLLLSFTPSWRDLPADLCAHVIRHPALPTDAERPAPVSWAALLPSFEGTPRDLPLNRVAPAEFATTG